ncbi:hypothetical protein BRADI_1g64444v3 [Brachypodium distachyon]|uniref:Uncharacterized protein n=1 Tax=Brachypodium distachyon TaxID=15368 RepID=A0A0Q3JXA5_BRADI|nr:hypothetical protein BRADI_1g64444v3 [Brachypodium distachyon]
MKSRLTIIRNHSLHLRRWRKSEFLGGLDLDAAMLEEEQLSIGACLRHLSIANAIFLGLAMVSSCNAATLESHYIQIQMLFPKVVRLDQS